MDSIYTIVTNPLFLFSISGIVSYLVCVRIFPVIIYISNALSIGQEPNHRSAHKATIPTLGGVGIFMGFAITFTIISLILDLAINDLKTIFALFAGIVILLFLGIKDDLFVLSPKKKILGQIFAAIILVVLADVRIESLFGLLGFTAIPYTVSLIISVILIVFFINAFNLIDGIDGLCASIAILSSIIFGLHFLSQDRIMMAIVSMALIGALIGFLKFNFSKHWKIFMGDSGSMVIGFVLVFQGIQLLNSSSIDTISLTFESMPLVVLSVLSFPIVDTLRVFIVRIWNGKSPFSADKNHIHHKIIGMGFNHGLSTSILCGMNIIVLCIALIIDASTLNIHIQIVLVCLTALVTYLSLFLLRLEQGYISFKIPYISNLN